MGGTHGCKVRYIYAWYQQRFGFIWNMVEGVTQMNDHFKAMMKTNQPSRFDNDEAWSKVEKLNQWMDDNGVDAWNEEGVIGVGPGETFTITNSENWFAEQYWIEVKFKIQWAFGFEILKEGYEEGLPWDEFGADVTDNLELEGAHKKFLKVVRFWEGVPAEFEHEAEEEGGFQVEREEPLTTQIGDWWDDKAFPALKGLAKAALIVVVVVVFIYLLIVFRGPIKVLIDELTKLLLESLKREG